METAKMSSLGIGAIVSLVALLVTVLNFLRDRARIKITFSELPVGALVRAPIANEIEGLVTVINKGRRPVTIAGVLGCYLRAPLRMQFNDCRQHPNPLTLYPHTLAEGQYLSVTHAYPTKVKLGLIEVFDGVGRTHKKRVAPVYQYWKGRFTQWRGRRGVRGSRQEVRNE